MQQAAEEKPQYFYRLVRVSRADGTATTVSMDPVLVTKACRVLGSFKDVNKLIRDAAGRYEKALHGSRSKFVSEQLQLTIAEALKQRASRNSSPD
jgi:hypothetical protein